MRTTGVLVGNVEHKGCASGILAILSAQKDVRIESIERNGDNFVITYTYWALDVKWLSGPTRQALEDLAVECETTTLFETCSDFEDVAREGLEFEGVINWSDDRLFRYFEDNMDFPGWDENEWSQPLVKASAEFAVHNTLTHKVSK